jgi:NADH dehydrogenase (ubiquinone) flavoprotein 2
MSATRNEMGGERAPSDLQHGLHEAGPHVPVFTGARRAELDELLTRYPTKMAALLPAYVKGVVTFYTMYHQHPVGRHFVQVCTTSPCNVCGAEDVVNALLKHTGCEDLGVTSADGKYTVIEVECLGACGFATPVMVNEQFIESVTPETVPALLASLS